MIQVNKKVLVKKAFFYAVGIIIIIFLLDIIFPLPNLKRFSKAVYSENGELLSAYLTKDDKWRLETNIDSVSETAIKVILFKEDKYFYYHPGVNPFAVVRAFIGNLTGEGRISGASTITMQLVRILEPHKRTLFNKILETFRAFQLELHYSKKEILNMYLSYAPYGGNIEGITSAAYIYFNNAPSRLSLAQAAELAVIPQNPNRYRPDKNPEQTLIKRNKLLRKLLKAHLFSEKDINLALQEPVSGYRFRLPDLAQHFSNYVSRLSEENQLLTTLNLKTQFIAEQLLHQHIQKLSPEGITNGAILVINNKSHQIKAYVGSADFYDDKISGQVNGINAIRSPGSTLKPFLYALLFDKGSLTPQTKIPDIPLNFGGYQPENFNMKFHGYVSAQYALANSLNIPAVLLLQKSGLKNFITLLEHLKFNFIKKSKRKLGLSTILGGCGVSLFELVTAYTVFANKGNLYIPQILLNNKNDAHTTVFSEEACYLISNILSSNERPDLEVNFFPDTKLPKIAWKTGTSQGKRDAWAIGYNSNYTIGVWLGNFDGKGAPTLTGSQKAVPLLIELFNSIDYGSSNNWFPFPKNLDERKVCAESGLLPNQYCKNFTYDYFIKNVTNNKKCDIHKEFYVSKDEKISYCTECLPKKNYIKKVYPVYPEVVSYWFKSQGLQSDNPPKHNPGCIASFNDKGPTILSPQKDFQYYINKERKEKILLQAVTDEKAHLIYWFVNQQIKTIVSSGAKFFYSPESDSLSLVCVDDLGRKSEMNVKIIFY